MTNVPLLDFQNVVASTKLFMVDSEMRSRMNGHCYFISQKMYYMLCHNKCHEESLIKMHLFKTLGSKQMAHIL